jgi:hypothetical protein
MRRPPNGEAGIVDRASAYPRHRHRRPRSLAPRRPPGGAGALVPRTLAPARGTPSPLVAPGRVAGPRRLPLRDRGPRGATGRVRVGEGGGRATARCLAIVSVALATEVATGVIRRLLSRFFVPPRHDDKRRRSS